MKGASLFLLFCLAAGLAAGQPGATYSPRYYSFISRGRELRTAKDYIGSGRMFDSGFQSAGWQGRPRDFYDAGCSWALAGVVDQAYIDLYRAVRQGKYAHPEEAEKDSDLVALRDTLDRIFTLDQSSRLAMDSIENRYGRSSRQMDSLYRAMSRRDSADQVRVREILSRRSWPSPDEVGERASMAVFLVIQHGDSLTHVTYLPMMQEAVQRGAARAEDLALLEDRLLTEQHKPQI